MKRKFCAIALSALMLVSGGMLSACGQSEKPDSSGGGYTGGDTPVTYDTQAYVNLDINPSIELVVDENGKVLTVRGGNEDGLVLLYGEDSLKGKDVEKAIEIITKLAIEYGYIDENNTVIDTIVSSGDSEFAQSILSKVNTKVTATADSLGMTVTTDGEGAYSLVRKMEELKKEFPNNAAVQNVTIEKMRLALSVSETGDISLDAAVALSDEALVEMLKNASLKIEEYATAAYLDAKAQAQAIYEKATALVEYKVYGEYYLEVAMKAMTNPTVESLLGAAKAYYGGIYQAYAASAKGFELVCDAYELANKMSNYAFNETQIAAVATALGMESTEPLKGSDGKITVESIEAYADKLFKNTPASESLEQMKKDLSAALATAESQIKTEIDAVSAEFKPQIEAALQEADNMIKTVEGMFNTVPESVKSLLTQRLDELKAVLAEVRTLLDGEEISYAEIKAKAEALKAKADEYYEMIENDLDDSELAEINAKITEEVAKLSAQKAALDSALESAEQTARDYLAGLKAERSEKAE